MFDTIGRDLDDEMNRRRAQSLLVSVLGMGAVTGFIVGLTAYTAVELVLDAPADVEMVELVLADPLQAPELPGLPPPPPPPAAAKADAPVDDTPEPDPDAEPEDLKEPVTEAIQTSAQPEGEDGGQDGGDPNGERGGMQGGTAGGTGDTLGSGGPRVFHHGELQTKRKITPTYPKAAAALDLGEQRCKAVVQIDAEGVPTSVDVQGCPSVFHAETRDTLLRWRWYPPKDGRRKVAAQTVIAITYTMR